MTEEEIINGNKLIAGFMGIKLENNWRDGYDYALQHVYGFNDEYYDCRLASNLGFHSSWDWLMPVVEKIWAITGCRTLFYFEANEKLTIYSNIQSSDAKIEIWSAVIEFIKWYNESKITKL